MSSKTVIYRYEGEFKNGYLDGKGIQTYSAPHDKAGERYEGELKDGTRNGKGTLRYSAPHAGAGQIYEGEWRNGKQINGTLTVDGKRYQAEFENGVIQIDTARQLQ